MWLSGPVRLPWLVGSEDGRVRLTSSHPSAGPSSQQLLNLCRSCCELGPAERCEEGNTTFIIALLVASTAVKKVDLSADKKVVYSAGYSVVTTVDSMVEKKVANLVEMKAMD